MEPELHPWNVDFTWTDRPGPGRVATEEQRAQFDRDGFFVLEGVLDVDTLRRTVDEIDEYEARAEEFLRKMDGERFQIAEADAITFALHLVAQSPWLRELAAHETFTGLCADLIGPDVRLYWDQAVYKKPEKPRRFPWHQDNGYTFIEPQQYLTCWVALTDATVDNGCPWVVPGLHRRGTLAHHYVDPLGWELFEDHPDKVPAEVGAGGVVVFSSLTPHLTGPNLTDSVRKAYILQYCPDGSARLHGEPTDGPPTGRELCEVPERQFLVVSGGASVTPTPLSS